MKILFSVLSLITSTLTLTPASVTFGWDPRPVNEAVTLYRFYEISGATNLVTSVATNQVTVTLSDGLHQVAVSSANIIGESVLSVPLFVFVSGATVVAVTNKPGAPINVQIR